MKALALLLVAIFATAAPASAQRAVWDFWPGESASTMLANHAYRATLDGALRTLTPTCDDTSATCTSEPLNMPVGNHTITVAAWWASVNEWSNPTAPLAFTVNPPPDTQAPMIAVISHTNGQTVTTATVTLSGTLSDNVGVISFLINGQPVSGTTAWSKPVTLVSGSNTFLMQARDAAGNIGSLNFTLVYAPPPADTTQPTLAVTSPVNGAIVTTTPITVSGTATDDVGVTSVTVNGLTATGTTSWSRSLVVTAGVNSITVIARDAAGNSTTQTLTVTYQPPLPTDVTAPALTITSPTNGQVFTSASITLQGTATDDVGVTSVTVNGQPATGTTSWSKAATLVAGTNTFTVQAQDAAGNLAVATRTVSYQPPPPSTTCTYNGTAYAIGATLGPFTMKNGQVDAFLAARQAEGWAVASRTRTKSQTTLTLICRAQ